jgi:6-phosphogluconolactonase (cycloisomerase 2 family)
LDPLPFHFDSGGTWFLAADKKNDNIAVFRVYRQSGLLEFTGNGIKTLNPIYVRFRFEP